MKFRNVAMLTMIALGFTGTLAACGGGGGGGPSLKDQELQGKIDGADWTYSAAAATVSDGDLSLDIYKGVEDPCNVGVDYDDWQILTTLPAEEGRRDLSVSFNEDGQTVTFAKESTNKIIGNGFIEITSLGESSVEGNLVAESDSENVVNGTFEATRCDNESSS